MNENIWGEEVLDSKDPNDDNSVLYRRGVIDDSYVLQPGGKKAQAPKPKNAFYTREGVFLGYDDKNEDKLYISTKGNYDYSLGITGEPGKKADYDNLRRYSTELSMKHSDFINSASTVYGESSFWMNVTSAELQGEMRSLAYVHYNYPGEAAYGLNSTAAKSFRSTSLLKRNGTKMQMAVEAQIYVLSGGIDLSGGARYWDGSDQVGFEASNDKLRDVYKKVNGKDVYCELHMNTRGWRILTEHYNAWKAYYGDRFKAPQEKISPAGPNKGKITYQSTAVWGGTIFWKDVNIKP
ncbi:hypothetical protein [Sphingobacterium sp.]|uniref:hypothetical protein n=1 Tax=Sphingobacterium sp. TaxID=341027 RepID=UPI00289D775A|nr:hypothetical protein [Sphingobacterium sp.]